MLELVFQMVEEDKKSKLYWLRYYQYRKHNKEITEMIKDVHKNIVVPRLNKIIGIE